jgi:hypothetical protein
VPAAPVRTVLTRIPDGQDREIHISSIILRPGLEPQIEIANYIPSTETYGRGFMFDESHRTKVAAGIRNAGRAQ